MATIPVGGLATGLDTESIIQKILQADAQPINLLQTKKVKFQALSTAFTDLNSRLISLKVTADGLKDPATFFPRSVSSSTDTVASATANAGNLRGTFTLTSTGLARGSIATAGVTKA